jgi:hypothetical protein
MKKHGLALVGLLGMTVYAAGITVLAVHWHNGALSFIAMGYVVGGGMMMTLLAENWLLYAIRPSGDPEFWNLDSSWQAKFAVVAWSPVSLFLCELGIYPKRQTPVR